MAVQSKHQSREKWQLFRNCSVKVTLLVTFCCYDHGTKASEEVQKFAIDQKKYRKCSLCVIICRIAKTYLSINNSEKWLVTGIPPT